jgi:Beta-eliminating lyase
MTASVGGIVPSVVQCIMMSDPFLLASTTLLNLPLSLQTYHRPPTQTLRDVLAKIEELEQQQPVLDPWDTYGDYDKQQPVTSSFLRQFEREVAILLGKDDAVGMPSGIMAQSIALLIHNDQHHHHQPKDQDQQQTKSNNKRIERSAFACHPTCHLLLHEQSAYAELLGMSAVVIHHHDDDRQHDAASVVEPTTALSVPPLLYTDVVRTLNEYYEPTGHNDKDNIHHALTNNHQVSTLILELPHREIGGQLTPWDDVWRIREYCDRHHIRFHCDGARFLEASVGGYQHESLSTTAAPFDSIYLSLYKGLGGLAGSILVGSTSFCAQARIWLTRFGGNLHTLTPYMIAGKLGLDRYYHLTRTGQTQEDEKNNYFSFLELTEKLQTIVALLQQDTDIAQIITFHPAVPQTNMVHGYFQEPAAVCHSAIAQAATKSGIKVLHRIRDLTEHDVAYQLGYRSMFEWTLGQVNGAVPVPVVHAAWKTLAQQLLLENRANGTDVLNNQS